MLSALAGMTLVSGAALAGIDWDSTSAFQAIAQPAAATQPADAAAQTTTPATEPAKLGSSQPKAMYLLSPDKFTSDEKVGWDGFLTGLRGFEHFYAPIGDPIYFESPFNNTEVRLLYVWHDFADGCQLNGGTLNILAAQVRVALTERLGFIATKDGYSFLNAGALPDGDGWNDLAAGLKYVAYASKEDDFVLTPGVRFQFQTGESDVLQNSCFEVSPFISFAKGWDKFHLIGCLTDRIPEGGHKGNNTLQWDLHADYEVFDGIAPTIELHGVHYLTDGAAAGLNVGGLDYTNLGSGNVAGSTVIWFGVGARVKLTPNWSFGAVYEHALTNVNADIMDQRVTLDFIFSW